LPEHLESLKMGKLKTNDTHPSLAMVSLADEVLRDMKMPADRATDVKCSRSYPGRSSIWQSCRTRLRSGGHVHVL
jgi:hypothetical protein